jgi:membrane protease subunit HflK
LQDVFSMVTAARENRNKALNEANSYTNRVFNESSAQATSITNAAAVASANYVKSITSEARRFNDLLPQYVANPDLFVQQMFVQAMSQAFTNVQDKFYLPQRADGKPRELRLQLNREPPEPKPAANP